MKAISLIVLMSLISFSTFSCQKQEDPILEYAVRIEAEVDLSSTNHFVIIEKDGRVNFLDAEKALARAPEVNFVWVKSADERQLELYSPQHAKVQEQFPEIADQLTAKSEFRTNGLDRAGVESLLKDGTKAEARQIFESAEPQEDPYQIQVGPDIGISALMDRGRWATLVWKYTYDSQGRMLFAAVVGVEFHP